MKIISKILMNTCVYEEPSKDEIRHEEQRHELDGGLVIGADIPDEHPNGVAE